jgi:hypothetical protein
MPIPIWVMQGWYTKHRDYEEWGVGSGEWGERRGNITNQTHIKMLSLEDIVIWR